MLAESMLATCGPWIASNKHSHSEQPIINVRRGDRDGCIREAAVLGCELASECISHDTYCWCQSFLNGGSSVIPDPESERSGCYTCLIDTSPDGISTQHTQPIVEDSATIKPVQTAQFTSNVQFQFAEHSEPSNGTT